MQRGWAGGSDVVSRMTASSLVSRFLFFLIAKAGGCDSADSNACLSIYITGHIHDHYCVLLRN